MSEPWKIWNQILEKVSAQGLGNLNDFEETVYRVNSFLCDMDNGGLTGFLYNVSPSNPTATEWTDLRRTAEAVESVGASACADALLQAASCFKTVSNAGQTWGKFLENPKVAELMKIIEPAVAKTIPDLWEKLEKFTSQKVLEFNDLG